MSSVLETREPLTVGYYGDMKEAGGGFGDDCPRNRVWVDEMKDRFGRADHLKE